MAGLDTIQKFEDGGEVNVKSGTKGQLTVPGNVPLDPTQTAELLKGMQDMLNERTGAMSTFLSGLKDATAWTAGGAQGPSQALAERDRQKLLEQQDIQGIRSNMALLKAAAAQEEQAKANYLGGVGTGAAGSVDASGLPTSTGTSGQIAISAEQKAIEDSLPRFTDKMEARRKYLASRVTESTKKEFAPGMADIVDIYVPGQGNVQMTKAQAERLLNANPNLQAIIDGQRVPAATVLKPDTSTTGGVNANNVGNVREPGKSTGFQQPKDINEGLQIMDKNLQAYAAKGINTLAGVISRWAPPSENDTATLIKNAAQRLGIDPNQPIDLNNPAVRQAVGTAIMLQEKGPQGIFGNKPAAATSAAAVPAKPGESRQEYEQRVKRQEELTKENIESNKESHKQFLDTTNAPNISSRESLNTRWEQWIKKNGPRSDKIVGLMNDPTIVNAVANVLTSGVQTTQGNVGIPGLEEAFQKMQKGVKKEDVEALQEIKQILESRILDVIKKSKGSSSDKDMDAFRTIAGSSKSGIDLINKLQQYDKLSIETDKADRALYDKLRKENKGAIDYGEYNSHPERGDLYKNHADRVRQIAQSQYVPTKAPVRPANVPVGSQYSPSTNSWWLNGKKVG